MSQAVTVSVRPDSVAVLTFDQPGSKANVLTRELWTAFGDALTALHARADLKGLVLESAKPNIFIAGADLKLLANASAPNDPEVRAFIEQGLRVLEQLEALPFPTCAAIDGAALGGGLEVALACDYRICGTNPKVQLGLPEVKLGLIPGWGGTQRLPRIVGIQGAIDAITSGDGMSTRDGEFLDLVATTVGSEQLLDFAQSFVSGTSSRVWQKERGSKHKPSPAQTVTHRPLEHLSTAAREAIRVVTECAALPLYDAIKFETEAFMRLAGSDESKRLIGEFFNRKK